MSKNTIEILKMAIQMEKVGLRTYLKFAKETKNETGKNMFIVLAGDELDHADVLEDQLESQTENKTWKKIQIEESVIQKIIPKISKDVTKTKGEEGIEQIDALKIALQQEKDSINFYTRQMEEIDDPVAKDLFRQLAEMEESHYKIQQAELDHIQGTGFWFDIPEFDLETG